VDLLQPLILYEGREELLNSLSDRFRHSPHVNFHGTYDIIDAGSTHKARVQSVANDIWKATGYRFTCVFHPKHDGCIPVVQLFFRVKDHPEYFNGHKTRFWCSQDEAHRSKSSRAARKAQGDLYKPRQTSSGETLAKNRYPCRSRLLISSRDSDTPNQCTVTVRMHHHVAHEPYVDLNLPPEVAQGVWNNYWWIAPGSTRKITSEDNTNEDTNSPPVIPELSAPEHDDSISADEHTPPEQDMSVDITHEMPQDNPCEALAPALLTAGRGTRPLSPALPHSQTMNSPPLSHDYHRRMHAHIHNLREFCDGLEYQLQFHDFRMLDVLEREGGPFLALVADCLRKEGRLVTTDQSAAPPPVSADANSSHMMDHLPSSNESVMHNSSDFERNPGVNPRALGC